MAVHCGGRLDLLGIGGCLLPSSADHLAGRRADVGHPGIPAWPARLRRLLDASSLAAQGALRTLRRPRAARSWHVFGVCRRVSAAGVGGHRDLCLRLLARREWRPANRGKSRRPLGLHCRKSPPYNFSDGPHTGPTRCTRSCKLSNQTAVPGARFARQPPHIRGSLSWLAHSPSFAAIKRSCSQPWAWRPLAPSCFLHR